MSSVWVATSFGYVFFGVVCFWTATLCLLLFSLFPPPTSLTLISLLPFLWSPLLLLFCGLHRFPLLWCPLLLLCCRFLWFPLLRSPLLPFCWPLIPYIPSSSRVSSLHNFILDFLFCLSTTLPISNFFTFVFLFSGGLFPFEPSPFSSSLHFLIILSFSSPDGPTFLHESSYLPKHPFVWLLSIDSPLPWLSLASSMHVWNFSSSDHVWGSSVLSPTVSPSFIIMISDVMIPPWAQSLIHLSLESHLPILSHSVFCPVLDSDVWFVDSMGSITDSLVPSIMSLPDPIISFSTQETTPSNSSSTTEFDSAGAAVVSVTSFWL